MMKNHNKLARGEGIEREAQKLRSLGIIMVFIGVINPVFLILGIIFLARSNDLKKRLVDDSSNEEFYSEPLAKTFCTNCGMQLESNDQYCFSCGEKSD
jgi:hypothetical protein